MAGWSRLNLGDRPVERYDPSGSTRRVVLFLHAHPATTLSAPHLIDIASATLERLNLACVAPIAGPTWWGDRADSEINPAFIPAQFVRDTVLPWIRSTWSGAIIGLAGIEMGGRGALTLAFQEPERFPVVASLRGAIELDQHYRQADRYPELLRLYSSAQKCRQDSPLFHIRPDMYPDKIWLACDPRDEDWARGNDRLDEKLNALGIAHQVDLTTSARGDPEAYDALMVPRMLEFLASAMTSQGRRLL